MAIKKYTIKDIAALSGLSKGTVDRVLHNRGKVSQKALDSINKVLKEIDYQPNIIARSLKKSKAYRICLIVPNAKTDPYWEPCTEGIREAFEEYKSLGVFIETHFYNPNDTSSFTYTCNKVLESIPDAVILPPLFYKQTLQAIHKFHSKKILVATFNDKISSELVECYVGQDLFRSGKIAARLLEAITPKKSELTVIHIDESFNNALHMQEKESGFRSYFKDLKETNISTLHIKQPDMDKTLNNHLSNNHIKGLFITTSKSFMIAQALDRIKRNDVKLIGYDLLKENIMYLKNQKIDFLIHQNPKQQAYLSITHIADYLLFNKQIPSEKLLPIDIINSENVDTYF